jgi:hypothetical protein
MSIFLDSEGKEDILKRASLLRLPITIEQLNGPLEVVDGYSQTQSKNYLISIPRYFQKLAILKKYCSICP